MLNPFTPGATVTRAVTTSTANVALTRLGSNQVMITCPAGGSVAFIKFGASTVEAAVTDLPILPGTRQIFTVPHAATHVAAICAASTSTIYATCGDGQ